MSLVWMVLLLTTTTTVDYVRGGKHIPIVNIEAVVGDPVYLPCDISTSELNDQVLLVLWYREDLGTPIYSVDGRERDFSVAERWSDENVFANRAYFMPEKKPAELGVDHIRESDQAIYRCRVDFKIAQTRNSKVNLTVIVPPQKIVITNESGAALTSVVGPFPEGASFTLKCDVFGAKPPPTVKWFRNNLAISNTTEIVSNVGISHVRSELRISNLRREDVHSELSCQATNNNGMSPLSATLHVDMNFGPLNVRILGANQPLAAGRRYDLLCQSSGSRPPATITWWKHGERMEKTKETTSNDGNMTTSTLSFVPKKDDDGKYLLCRADNKMISSEGLEDGWKLEIHYIPEVKINLGTSLNPDAIREGSDVYFDCIINARPPVYKVEWRQNGNLLSINIGAGIIITNQSLVLQGVSRSTAGNYTCVGYNTEGDGESSPFYLNVLYKPICKPNQIRIFGVSKQEKAQITCEVVANPSNVEFRWVFNNSADSFEVTQSHVTKSGTSSVVYYTPAKELDYGTLLCYGSNKIGTQKIPCVYHIIAAGRPDQVHNCSIFNISTSTFSIKCSEGFNGGVPQYFLLEIRESESNELKGNLTSPAASFSVTGLKAGKQYYVSLFSYNSKGRSASVILQTSTLHLPEKQLTAEKSTAFGFTPITTVLVSTISTLLIILIVAIGVLRLRLYDAKRQRCQKKIGSSNFEQKDSSYGAMYTDKGGGSPISKYESSTGECDSDEKNPDIIPQPTEADDIFDYTLKQQHISTIETSPTGNLVYQSNNPEHTRYCSLKNGIPFNKLTSQSKLISGSSQMIGQYSSCTLPRLPHHSWQYNQVHFLPSSTYSTEYRSHHIHVQSYPLQGESLIAMQPLDKKEKESKGTLLTSNKRESTV